MCVHVLTHAYTHKHTYPGIHMCTQVQTCLHTQMPLYTTAHPHICRHEAAHVYTDGIHSHVHTFAYRTTFKDLKACTCPFAHSVHSRTGSPLLSMRSNHEFTGRPLVSSTSGWLSLPSLFSLPQPHDRQLLLLPTPMPVFSFPPPRGPQIPD